MNLLNNVSHNLLSILKDLVKIYFVVFIIDLLWPGPKNVNMDFIVNSMIDITKYTLPGYIMVKMFFYLKK